MPLKLQERPKSNITIRGTYMGVAVHRTTGTRDRALATEILGKVKGAIEKEVHGVESQNPFDWVAERLANPLIENTYIYCMKSEEFVKIGVADDPKERLVFLSLGNPHGIELVGTWRVRRRISRAIEGLIHKRMSHCAVGREWFRATPEEAILAIEAEPGRHTPRGA